MKKKTPSQLLRKPSYRIPLNGKAMTTEEYLKQFGEINLLKPSTYELNGRKVTL